MKINILDKESSDTQKLLSWLSQDRRVSAFEVFRDVEAMIRTMADFPAEICIIRLGYTAIQGLEAASMVKKICSDTKIVFISDDGEYALDAYAIGAFGYLISPIEKLKFEEIMREVV